MENCKICPRSCGINRNKLSGFCGTKKLKVSYVMLHKWEEPLISGNCKTAGSGAIFFSGCNLKCVYCQNKDISGGGNGKEITPYVLAEIIKKLEKDGAVNINLVTPTHFTDEIIAALNIYKPNIPVVWNTSGYEKVETIEKLTGYVDIFLTDLKYVNDELSFKLSNAKDYFNYASKAIIKMRKIVGEDKIENGLMKKGLIVRHLILPGFTSDSVNVLNWIKENLGVDTIVSLMSQYTPNGTKQCVESLNNKISKIEYNRVVKKAIALGFTNAFIQDSDSSSTQYIPKFYEKNKYI